MADARRFVIQQHDATRLHWDLRLEHEGVLRSWALPRGVPWNPKENRLAVATEDHTMDFLDHEGDTWDGRFGTGRSTRWDSGTYEVHKMEDKKVVFTLHGTRVSGKYSLFSMRGSRDWLIHRMDPPADEGRRAVPSGVVPMQAGMVDVVEAAAEAPNDWIFERRLTGVRAIVTDDTGRVVITDAAGNDISIGFPEVRRIGRAIGHREVILDGVIMPLAADGELRGDREDLDRRLRLRSDSGARNAARSQPMVFVAVDLLWWEGRSTAALPWHLRRRQLDDLRLNGPGWRTSEVLTFDEILPLADEGVVAKRPESAYVAGKVTTDWIESVGSRVE